MASEIAFANNTTVGESDDGTFSSGYLIGSLGFAVVFVGAFSLMCCFIKSSKEQEDDEEKARRHCVKPNLVRVHTVAEDDMQAAPSGPSGQADISRSDDINDGTQIDEGMSPSLANSRCKSEKARRLHKAKTCSMDVNHDTASARRNRIGSLTHAMTTPSLEERPKSLSMLEDLEVLEGRPTVCIVNVADSKVEVLNSLKQSLKEAVASRRKTFKFLCAKWHPDKHIPPNVESATEVFQFVQEQRSWYLDC